MLGYLTIIFFLNKKIIIYYNAPTTLFAYNLLNNFIDLILKTGTEADKQLNIYNESGFEKLKKYLMESVEYN